MPMASAARRNFAFPNTLLLMAQVVFLSQTTKTSASAPSLLRRGLLILLQAAPRQAAPMELVLRPRLTYFAASQLMALVKFTSQTMEATSSVQSLSLHASSPRLLAVAPLAEQRLVTQMASVVLRCLTNPLASPLIAQAMSTSPTAATLASAPSLSRRASSQRSLAAPASTLTAAPLRQ